jgi:hypothetical protein
VGQVLKKLKPKAREMQERNKLLEKAIRWRILVKRLFPEEGATLHSFTPEFQASLEARVESMKKNRERRFDEKVMAEVITDHLHDKSGYNDDEIMRLINEKCIFEEDGREFYELCILLTRFMITVYNQGLDYPIGQNL